MIRRLLMLAPVAGLWTLALAAQAPASREPAFEVASIKPNRSGASNASSGPRPGGFAATNVPLRMLILNAYWLKPYQIVGGPGWINADRFDIVARMPDGASPDLMLPMLRTLLVDRFKLVTHMETRETAIYALIPIRSDRRLGPQIRPAAGCDAPVVTAPAAATQNPCGVSSTFGGRNGGSMKASGQTFADLAEFLGQNLDRLVVDRTGMDGRFDFDLRWGGDGVRTTDATTAGDLPSVFTALTEQLGLRLEPARGPVPFLVIDSAEQPAPD